MDLLYIDLKMLMALKKTMSIKWERLEMWEKRPPPPPELKVFIDIVFLCRILGWLSPSSPPQPETWNKPL